MAPRETFLDIAAGKRLIEVRFEMPRGLRKARAGFEAQTSGADGVAIERTHSA